MRYPFDFFVLSYNACIFFYNSAIVQRICLWMCIFCFVFYILCAFSVLFSIYYVHFLFCFLYIVCIFFFLLFLKNSVLLCSNTYVQIFLLTSRVEALFTGVNRTTCSLFFSFLFSCKIICTWMYSISWLLDWHHLLEPVTAGILMLHSLLNCQQVRILLVSNLSQKCPFYSVSL